jgi:predicted acylesterase/phospholipase RssA
MDGSREYIKMLEPKTAIVFSGGGARGAYTAGVAMAFKQCQRYPAIVSGTSVGALIAAMVVSGEEEKLVDIWKHLTPQQVYRKRRTLNFLLSFVSNYVYPGFSAEPLGELIKKNVDMDKIRKSPRHFLVTCYNQTLQQVERFDNQTESLHTVLLASTALPIIFSPVRMNGYEYVDMGATDVPLKPVVAIGAEKIYVVLSDHPDDYRRPVRNNLDWAINVMHLAQRDNVLLDIELARRTNLVTNGTDYRFLDVTIIYPSRSLSLGFMDFHKRHHIHKAIELGLEDGLRVLKQTSLSHPASQENLAGHVSPQLS